MHASSAFQQSWHCSRVRAFCESFSQILLETRQFEKCIHDTTLLRRTTNRGTSYVCQYVDDALVIASDNNTWEELQIGALMVTLDPHRA